MTMRKHGKVVILNDDHDGQTIVPFAVSRRLRAQRPGTRGRISSCLAANAMAVLVPGKSGPIARSHTKTHRLSLHLIVRRTTACPFDDRPTSSLARREREANGGYSGLGVQFRNAVRVFSRFILIFIGRMRCRVLIELTTRTHL